MTESIHCTGKFIILTFIVEVFPIEMRDGNTAGARQIFQHTGHFSVEPLSVKTFAYYIYSQLKPRFNEVMAMLKFC